MSASSRPTLAPIWASAQAMLALTVLLPTPPLPEATATMFLTPGMACCCGMPRPVLARTLAVISIWMSSTPGTASTAARHMRSISALSGQAGVVSSTVNATAPPLIATFLIMLSVTKSLCRSGS